MIKIIATRPHVSDEIENQGYYFEASANRLVSLIKNMTATNQHYSISWDAILEQVNITEQHILKLKQLIEQQHHSGPIPIQDWIKNNTGKNIDEYA